VAIDIFTGIATIPKLIAPFQKDVGIYSSLKVTGLQYLVVVGKKKTMKYLYQEPWRRPCDV
jgi:hypothetical protein